MDRLCLRTSLQRVVMRGIDTTQSGMFSYVSPEQRVPKDHPLRSVRPLCDVALKALSREFDRMYSDVGRPSIAPEKLLRALLLQILYTIRSERLLMEQLDYNLLFRWFVGLNMDDAVWDATVFSKNRDRMLKSDIAGLFFQAVVEEARVMSLLSDEHFSVDGTLIEAWASQKSFQKKDNGESGTPGDGGNAAVDFHGEQRTNQTHESKTDPDARLYRKGKGKEAKLCYAGHVVMENRNGLAVDGQITKATGTAERDAALDMLGNIADDKRVTVGTDKAYDTHDFVEKTRTMNVTPHVTQNTNGRSSAIDGRTTRHEGYVVSLRCRARIEEIFGWLKTVGGQRKTRYRGEELVGWMFELSLAAYNLVRMRRLLPDAA
jgi:transposase